MRIFNWECTGRLTSDIALAADAVCTCLSELGIDSPCKPVYRLAADVLGDNWTADAVQWAMSYVAIYEVGNYSTFDYEVLK